ncbi:MAG: FtsW/RodA/SpoVE family cell cycle protein [Spirochaetota bacterium]
METANTRNNTMNFGFAGGMKIDIILIIATVILITIGIMFIYSSEYVPEEYKMTEIKVNVEEETNLKMYIKQILFCIPGVLLAFLTFLIGTNKIQSYAWFLYFAIILLLILVFLFGVRIYGSKSWFGIAGFGIQPSEFAKLILIIVLSKYISIVGEKIKNWKYYILGLFICSPILGLILLQPDFGTILVFLPVIMIILFMGGCSILHLLTTIFAGTFAIIGGIIIKAPYLLPNEYQFLLTLFLNFKNILIIVSSSAVIIILSTLLLKKYKGNLVIRIILAIFLAISIGFSGSIGTSNVIKDHHVNRFISFLDPSADPQNTGYSLKQSIVAIGAGGSTGQGWLEGKQNQLGFITVKWADYIFSLYAEEMGFRGTLLLLILYALLLFRGIVTIYYAKDMFGGLTATGIISLIIFQVFINLSVTIGILPVVGITLPFISAGGSSLITFTTAIGLLIAIQYEGKSKNSVIL